MRTSLALLFAGLLALPGTTAAQADKKAPNILEEMKRREKEIKASESRQAWKKVAWRSSPAEAVADATKRDRPLLVVLIVGELGRPKADRC